MVKSILLAGVGGQGTILASKILIVGLCEMGYDVKMSEIHGMSQRGGSVTTQIRYGQVVYAPVIGLGEADLLVSFEEMETYRYLPYLKPNGNVILNRYRIPSAPMLAGSQQYPDGLVEKIEKLIHTTVVDATAISLELGVPKAANVVLLGALIRSMELQDLNWEAILRQTIKPQFLESNLKALAAGMACV